MLHQTFQLKKILIEMNCLVSMLLKQEIISKNIFQIFSVKTIIYDNTIPFKGEFHASESQFQKREFIFAIHE